MAIKLGRALSPPTVGVTLLVASKCGRGVGSILDVQNDIFLV